MQLTIRGKNVKVSDDRKDLIERKLGKLGHYLDIAHDATVELTAEHAHRASERLAVEMTVRVNGTILRGEERDNDLGVALDRLHDKMQRQFTRYKERIGERKGKMRLADAAAQIEPEITAEVAVAAPEPSLEDTLPVKTKKFEVIPMAAVEAIEELENVGHDFYVFLNVDTNSINVVYRRQEGGYGLLQPEQA